MDHNQRMDAIVAFVIFAWELLRDENGISEESFSQLCEMNDVLGSHAVGRMIENVDATDGRFYLSDDWNLRDFTTPRSMSDAKERRGE